MKIKALKLLTLAFLLIACALSNWASGLSRRLMPITRNGKRFTKKMAETETWSWQWVGLRAFD
jgi:hypothetical protein